MTYISEASEADTVKIFKDLLNYYECIMNTKMKTMVNIQRCINDARI